MNSNMFELTKTIRPQCLVAHLASPTLFLLQDIESLIAVLKMP